MLSGSKFPMKLNFRHTYSTCCLKKQAYEYVFNENSVYFQMMGSTRSTLRGLGDPSGSNPPPPPPPNMTPAEAFIAAQTEVLCNILQTQQQIVERLQQPSPREPNNDGLNVVTQYGHFLAMRPSNFAKAEEPLEADA
jgi:hypothetical protein